MLRENKLAIVVAALILITVPQVSAGFLEVEVPAGVTAEDALNPTPELRATLEGLISESVAAHPSSAEFGVVVLTKNGETIIEPKTEDVDGWEENRLGFEPAFTPENEFLWPGNEGSWDAARWHLREVGQEHGYNGVYALAEDIFGYPFWTGEVKVNWSQGYAVEPASVGKVKALFR